MNGPFATSWRLAVAAPGLLPLCTAGVGWLVGATATQRQANCERDDVGV